MTLEGSCGSDHWRKPRVRSPKVAAVKELANASHIPVAPEILKGFFDRPDLGQLQGVELQALEARSLLVGPVRGVLQPDIF